MPRLKTLTRYLLGALFIAAGVNHFVMTDFYVAIMPPYLPWHLGLWLRLPAQGLLIAWAWWYTRK